MANQYHTPQIVEGTVTKVEYTEASTYSAKLTITLVHHYRVWNASEKKEEAGDTYYTATLWGKKGDDIRSFVKEGMEARIAGTIRIRNWKNNEGEWVTIKTPVIMNPEVDVSYLQAQEMSQDDPFAGNLTEDDDPFGGI